MFDQRLAAKVIRTVDVSYGGENGFNQAIELVQDDLSNVKFVQEKKLICKSILYKFSLTRFRPILRRNQPRYRQVLLRYRRYSISTGAGCRRDFNYLGEFGYQAIRLP